MTKTKEQDFLIKNVIATIVGYLAEDNGITIEEAFKIFFSTKLAKKIEDVETGYYWESPSYTYEILKEELVN
jgi:hypothetical protein